MTLKCWQVLHNPEQPGHFPETWSVMLNDYDPENHYAVASTIVFDSEAVAKRFAEMGRSGASQRELHAFVEQLPPPRIRYAEMD
jgi:hypothetical protein